MEEEEEEEEVNMFLLGWPLAFLSLGLSIGAWCLLKILNLKGMFLGHREPTLDLESTSPRALRKSANHKREPVES